MIHHAKIIELLHRSAPDLVANSRASFDLLLPIIKRMVADNEFWNLIQQRDDVPICLENTAFDHAHEIKPFSDRYVALGVDGSQIYPDRHSGISCFLLHIGSILIQYGSLHGNVAKESESFLFSHWDTCNDSVHTHDIVDTERFLKELQYGFEQAQTYKQKHPKDRIILFTDGPLLFWHNAQKPVEFQKKYLTRYINILQLFEAEHIPIVGYTSMPRSRELTKIVKTYIQYTGITNEEIKELCAHLTDTQLIALFLKPNHRTASFKSNAMTHNNGQTNYEINFVYINTCTEYIRLEMPSWINRNEEISNFAYEATMHQIKNGFGYPTVLSLAHEQAVIKNADRIFFTKMLHKTLLNYDIQSNISQKQFKKDFGEQKR